MNRIVLTEDEIKIIEKDLKKEFNPFDATDEEKEILMGVLDKAEELMHELKAYEESGGSLLKWFYNKFKEQNGE